MNYLETAIKAAKAAEEVIMKHYGSAAVSLKADQSIVTIADKEAEKIISSIIRENFPTHAILGEEGGKSHGSEDFTWIIDPIDGTNNYARSIPAFGTLIALFHGKEILVGVSNMPAMNEMVYAEQGKGAFCNGKPLHVSNINQLAEAYLAYGGLKRFQAIGLASNLLELCAKMRGHRGFGDCWMYHLLAEGKVDIVLEAAVNIWDIAPGALIVKEAGGHVTDLAGKEVDMNTTSLLAANNEHLHSETLKILQKKQP